MKAQSLLVTLLILLSLAACKKEKAIPINLKGTYIGKLYSTSPGAAETDAQLVITDKTYNTSINTHFHANSYGSYIVNNKEITFTDSLAHTADFDSGLVLAGKYTLTTKSDSLILVKRVICIIISIGLRSSSEVS
ncbi:hypothetical protein SNE25_01375 [Mucilaginibacter sabulilitoris]|uniref:Lipocalin-like domain-containing protein n=1 Tax=Mucilaginibacter sabulilitoris TaxID=1173583 RepID=A0ABZ0TQZ7_9SPHI|nr:hypothetical protein [Mucilaginibacter sabulilitoris]WPU94174.1 hypothetical protein SNE25_01375 [Mucilaginibacter sabulilitoris]